MYYIVCLKSTYTNSLFENKSTFQSKLSSIIRRKNFVRKAENNKGNTINFYFPYLHSNLQNGRKEKTLNVFNSCHDHVQMGEQQYKPLKSGRLLGRCKRHQVSERGGVDDTVLSFDIHLSQVRFKTRDPEPSNYKKIYPCFIACLSLTRCLPYTVILLIEVNYEFSTLTFKILLHFQVDSIQINQIQQSHLC